MSLTTHCIGCSRMIESRGCQGPLTVNMSATWRKLYHLAVKIDDNIRIPDTTQVPSVVFNALI